MWLVDHVSLGMEERVLCNHLNHQIVCFAVPQKAQRQAVPTRDVPSVSYDSIDTSIEYLTEMLHFALDNASGTLLQSGEVAKTGVVMVREC